MFRSRGYQPLDDVDRKNPPQGRKSKSMQSAKGYAVVSMTGKRVLSCDYRLPVCYLRKMAEKYAVEHGMEPGRDCKIVPVELKIRR